MSLEGLGYELLYRVPADLEELEELEEEEVAEFVPLADVRSKLAKRRESREYERARELLPEVVVGYRPCINLVEYAPIAGVKLDPKIVYLSKKYDFILVDLAMGVDPRECRIERAQIGLYLGKRGKTWDLYPLREVQKEEGEFEFGVNAELGIEPAKAGVKYVYKGKVSKTVSEIYAVGLYDNECRWEIRKYENTLRGTTTFWAIICIPKGERTRLRIEAKAWCRYFTLYNSEFLREDEKTMLVGAEVC